MLDVVAAKFGGTCKEIHDECAPLTEIMFESSTWPPRLAEKTRQAQYAVKRLERQ